ncbi:MULTISPECIES: PaaI family thioesterase [Novosphingobium]|uniref:Uncharacterized domain 1-containing protein n=1 Tax=Novosphingobium mathurense TaxID=428990 RepID=A0A1U6HY30_9SPHN|nr:MULTISPECIES: PaaI family thioesterase [Novosphingobium]SLK00695.1 uncharacterized domain 1-containing protein [Novosphingobium mathurense]
MISATPYAQLLGIGDWMDSDGSTGLVLRASSQLEGREGFLYGGVIASLLELACLEAVSRELDDPGRRPKPINMTYDFLRGGRMVDCYAKARVVRIGKRVVNADATCWQSDAQVPIATGRMHLLLA